MWQGCYAPGPLLLSAMEVIIDPLRQRFVDPFDGRKIGGGGAAHALCRPETVEQGLLAPHANARNLIQRVLSEVRSSPPGAMRADGPAVRLVAKSLEIIERRIVRRQHERRPARPEELLAPGVAIGSLGDRDEVDLTLGETELSQRFARSRELAKPAIDQDEIRPCVGALAYGNDGSVLLHLPLVGRGGGGGRCNVRGAMRSVQTRGAAPHPCAPPHKGEGGRHCATVVRLFGSDCSIQLLPLLLQP